MKPLYVFGFIAVTLIFLPPSAGALGPSVHITVVAGSFDRSGTVVTFNSTYAVKDMRNYQLRDARTTRLIPVQIDPSGTAIFIEPDLPSGQTRSYELIEKDSGSDVRAVKSGSMMNLFWVGKPLLSYQMDLGPVPEDVPAHFQHGAHLHPVFSPGGKLVTGNHPPDHRWHRGIWFGWTDTDFEGRHPDFWNMGKEKDGKLTGEVRFDKLERSWSGAVHGGFVSQHRWIDHTSGAEKDVLHETWEVKVFQPITIAGKPVLQLFDLTSTQTCAGKEPLKLPKYHYGGLGVRGNAAWDPKDKVTMLTSEGHDRKAGDSTKGKWVWLGGDVDGGPTGMAVLIHPDNFRFPQPLRLNPSNPQLCVAPSQDGDWEITPGKPYVSRYRFVVFDGKPDAAELDRLWNGYAHLPKVTVE